MSTIALHTTFIISETVRDSGLVPKDHHYEMAYRPMGYHVWFEAVRSAILVIAWLLVFIFCCFWCAIMPL